LHFDKGQTSRREKREMTGGATCFSAYISTRHRKGTVMVRVDVDRCLRLAEEQRRPVMPCFAIRPDRRATAIELPFCRALGKRKELRSLRSL
jgi:hypothetical protein